MFVFENYSKFFLKKLLMFFLINQRVSEILLSLVFQIVG